MREVFEGSGLFYSSDEANRRSDVYLNDGNHTALCQDGGDDGVYGYDARLEAIKVTPPAGVALSVMLHVEGVGNM